MWRLFSLIFLINFFLNHVDSSLIKVSVDKKRVHTGEVFTYKVEMKLPFNPQEIKLPKFEGLKVISRSQKSSYNIGRDKIIVKIKMVFKLVAFSPGKYVIKNIVVKGKNRVIKSEKVEIEVYGERIKKKERIFKGESFTI